MMGISPLYGKLAVDLRHGGARRLPWNFGMPL